MIPQAATKLAYLMFKRKQQGQAALSLDGYDRWGRGSSYPDMEADIAFAAQAPQTERQIQDMIQSMRTDDPDTLEYFIQGQIQLLDLIIAKDNDSTAVFVAKEERQHWDELRAGTRDIVRRNPHYIHEDKTLFLKLFGPPPDEV